MHKLFFTRARRRPLALDRCGNTSYCNKPDFLKNPQFYDMAER
jgi:hypothetical protein